MAEMNRAGYRKSKRKRGRGIRLLLEELEGRCLFSLGVMPIGGITAGPDGNLWFPEGDRIGEINATTGVIQEYALPPGVGTKKWIAVGSDGEVWFVEYAEALGRLDPSTGLMQYAGALGRLDPANGLIQQIALPDGTSAVGPIVAGLDGNIWFEETTSAGDGIARIDPLSGNIKEFPYNGHQSADGTFVDNMQYRGDMVYGPDGCIWFAKQQYIGAPDLYYGWIGQLNPATGALTSYVAPGVGLPMALTVAPDGNIWFTLVAGLGSVGKIDFTTGAVTNVIPPPGGFVSLAILSSYPDAIASSPEGDIWFASNEFGCISRLNPTTGVVKTFPMQPDPDYGSVPVQGMTFGPDGNLWLTYWSSLVQMNPDTGAVQQFLGPASRIFFQGNPTRPAGAGSASLKVSAKAGIDFLTAIATFTPQAAILSPGQANQVTVNWGDGTTSSLILTVTQNGTYDVIGEHTYQSAGTYNIQVTIGTFDPANPLGDNPVTVFSTANVDPFNMNM